MNKWNPFYRIKKYNNQIEKMLEEQFSNIDQYDIFQNESPKHALDNVVESNLVRKILKFFFLRKYPTLKTFVLNFCLFMCFGLSIILLFLAILYFRFQVYPSIYLLLFLMLGNVLISIAITIAQFHNFNKAQNKNINLLLYETFLREMIPEEYEILINKSNKSIQLLQLKDDLKHVFENPFVSIKSMFEYVGNEEKNYLAYVSVYNKISYKNYEPEIWSIGCREYYKPKFNFTHAQGYLITAKKKNITAKQSDEFFLIKPIQMKKGVSKKTICSEIKKFMSEELKEILYILLLKYRDIKLILFTNKILIMIPANKVTQFSASQLDKKALMYSNMYFEYERIYLLELFAYEVHKSLTGKINYEEEHKFKDWKKAYQSGEPFVNQNWDQYILSIFT